MCAFAEKNVNGFRFSSHGNELPAKTINFEDIVTPMVETKAKAQYQKKPAKPCGHNTSVQNDSEQIAQSKKRSKKARVLFCVCVIRFNPK